jgi:spore germination cell wall hydrolase CwlJ-like protein
MIDAKAILLSIMGLFPSDEVKDINVEEAYCMALNIYHESQGERAPGKAAIGHVTLTRLKDSRFPSTVCGVVKHVTRMRKDSPNLPALHKCAFSWYCDGKSDSVKFYENGDRLDINVIAFTETVITAILVMNGTLVDNTGGATHYYNHTLASPRWASIYPKTAEHGDHHFHIREKGSLL